jgi:DNA-binding response OmpR family regulator
VLIVEDDADLARALALDHAGYEVRVEHDGPAALHAGAEWPPDLVVLDLGLRDVRRSALACPEHQHRDQDAAPTSSTTSVVRLAVTIEPPPG